MKSFDQFNEEAGANCAGAGNVAGIGTTNASKPENFGEPGLSKKKQVLIRRKSSAPVHEDVATDTFAGNKVFVVPSAVFHRVKLGKKSGAHWTKYIGEDEHGQAIREYARKNYGKPIVLQDSSTKAMAFAHYGKRK